MNRAGAALSSFEASGSAPFVASVSLSWAPMLDLWTRMAEAGAALAFQRRDWLEPWADTIGRRPEIDLLAVTVRNAHGRPVAALPLVREKRGIRRIGFADGGLSDYNAPILSREAPQDAAGAALLWRSILKALPAADVVRFERMPSRIGDLANPFALLPSARPSSIEGLMLAMPNGYGAWRQSLPRRYRMELGRCARLFDAVPQATFQRPVSDGAPVFASLEKLQRERIETLGLSYILDEPGAKRFYRRLSEPGDAAGVLTALVVNDEAVAALFGLRHGATFIMLRIGASPAYARMSPARDLIVRTMELLSREGVSTFDFGLGDYPYKRKLGGTPHHLVDLVAARSPLGLAEATEFRLRAYVRQTPRLRATARRLRSLVRRDRGSVGEGL